MLNKRSFPRPYSEHTLVVELTVEAFGVIVSIKLILLCSVSRSRFGASGLENGGFDLEVFCTKCLYSGKFSFGLGLGHFSCATVAGNALVKVPLGWVELHSR